MGSIMSARRARQARAREKGTTESRKRRCPRLAAVLLPFAFGVVLTVGGFLLYTKTTDGTSTFAHSSYSSPDTGRRTVAQLMALPDAELEKIDIVEMNIAVAREIPGLENLDYAKYRQIVDGWTAQFRAWLPTVEHAFRQEPGKFHNDIIFFRLGMLAQFLDRSVGVAYVEEQRQAQVEARKAGRKAEVAYTDPGHLLLHGLIDTKRGTCGTCQPCTWLSAGGWAGR